MKAFIKFGNKIEISLLILLDIKYNQYIGHIGQSIQNNKIDKEFL